MRLAKPLYYFTALLALFTYLLIIVGGLVTNTDSGMACPDWPLCYGDVFPQLTGHILFEHGHRYLASLTGFGVIFISIVLWNRHAAAPRLFRAKRRMLWGFLALTFFIAILISAIGQGNEKWAYGAGHWPGLIALLHLQTLAPWLIGAALVACYALAFRALLWPGAADEAAPLAFKGLGLLMLILIQGLLGGATVAYNLPSIVTTAHLATSMLVLLTMIYLAFEFRRIALAERDPSVPAWPPAAGARQVNGLLLLTTALVFLQIILGALVRHTHASWNAGIGWEHAILGQDPATGKTSLWPADGRARLNLAHRYFACVAVAMIFYAAWRSWAVLGPSVGEHLQRVMLIWLPAQLVVLQVLVGMMMIGLLIEIGMRTLHLAVGTLVLASQFLLMINVRAAAPKWQRRRAADPRFDPILQNAPQH